MGSSPAPSGVRARARARPGGLDDYACHDGSRGLAGRLDRRRPRAGTRHDRHRRLGRRRRELADGRAQPPGRPRGGGLRRAPHLAGGPQRAGQHPRPLRTVPGGAGRGRRRDRARTHLRGAARPPPARAPGPRRGRPQPEGEQPPAGRRPPVPDGGGGVRRARGRRGPVGHARRRDRRPARDQGGGRRRRRARPGHHGLRRHAVERAEQRAGRRRRADRRHRHRHRHCTLVADPRPVTPNGLEG